MTAALNRRLAVLISGRGSNLQSILDAIANRTLDAIVAIVISNRSEAAGLDRARAAGIETMSVLPRDYPSRDDCDRAIVEILRTRDVGLVCLAGYMRIVGRPLLEAFEDRILNIHPSLLPAFPGLEAQTQAFEYGVKVSGCTVHFVDADLDHGAIILQKTVPVLDTDNDHTLAARILEQEHIAYSEAIRFVLEGRYTIVGRRVAMLK